MDKNKKSKWGVRIAIILSIAAFGIKAIQSINSYQNSDEYKQKKKETYERAKKERTKDLEPIPYEKVIGKWKSKPYLFGGEFVTREIYFFDKGIGKFRYEIFATEVDSLTYRNNYSLLDEMPYCFAEIYFYWDSKAERRIQNIEIQPKAVNFSNCFNKKIKTSINNAFSNIKLRSELEIYTERIEISKYGNREGLFVDGEIYKFQGKISNWEGEVVEKLPELTLFFEQKERMNYFIDGISDSFVKENETQSTPIFDILIENFNLIIKGEASNSVVAEGVIFEDEYYLKPTKWVSIDDSFYKYGIVESVNYIDAKGERQNGDLQIFSHGQEGFLFAEIDNGFWFW